MTLFRFVFSLICAAYLSFTNVNSLLAQVTAPSTFTTAIQVQGEDLGTEFDDWNASGISVVDADPADNPGFLDIANIQVANDNDFLYIRATFYSNESSPNLFLAFDTDQDSATGFDTLQAGLLGSEFGYQNDFAFHQAAGTFNTNIALTGGPFGNGGALLFPFWDQDGPEKEWAIPRDAMITFPAPGVPTFPNNSFDFVVYTDEGLGDVSQVISYTFAEAPPGQPGDFDSDLDVDGADFLEWQREFGNTLGASDLTDWQTNYGPGALSAVSAVPEPSSVFLAGLGLASLAMHRRRV
ncbi:MAG: PEP-CTERM sorting domain-containing protein [Planctomycetes bacterium]|nr:PEP-CTERM sorting domain-containing protein [Planctomycetota bacterium]